MNISRSTREDLSFAGDSSRKHGSGVINAFSSNTDSRGLLRCFPCSVASYHPSVSVFNWNFALNAFLVGKPTEHAHPIPCFICTRISTHWTSHCRLSILLLRQFGWSLIANRENLRCWWAFISSVPNYLFYLLNRVESSLLDSLSKMY